MSSIFPQLEDAGGKFTAISVGQVNGVPAFARVMDDFDGPMHIHEASDELFIVLNGIVYLDFDNNSVMLQAGDSYTVPAGMAHKSRVPGRAELIVIGGQG